MGISQSCGAQTIAESLKLLFGDQSCKLQWNSDWESTKLKHYQKNKFRTRGHEERTQSEKGKKKTKRGKHVTYCEAICLWNERPANLACILLTELAAIEPHPTWQRDWQWGEHTAEKNMALASCAGGRRQVSSLSIHVWQRQRQRISKELKNIKNKIKNKHWSKMIKESQNNRILSVKAAAGMSSGSSAPSKASPSGGSLKQKRSNKVTAHLFFKTKLCKVTSFNLEQRTLSALCLLLQGSCQPSSLTVGLHVPASVMQRKNCEIL